MDTDMENAFYVLNREDGIYIKYTRCATTNVYTLYVVGVGKESEVLLHSTLEGERNKFSRLYQTSAKAVHELQEMLASPRDYDLANIIKSNVIRSIHFTRRDVRIATLIHGCDIAGIKRKTTRKPSKIRNPNEVRDILSHIVMNYSEVSLYIDVIHDNGIMFLV